MNIRRAFCTQRSIGRIGALGLLMIVGLVGTGILPSIVGAANAQTYPDRPIRIIVPFAAGGVADIATRIAAERVGEKLGQRFIIENIPGAGGITAARTAAAAAPDGYTIILLTNGTAISVNLFRSLPFDPFKDFAPISGLGRFDCLLVANADSEFHNLKDFVSAAQEKPGAMNVGTISIGSTQDLAAELFKSTARIDYTIVPFRTSHEAVVALLRNDIQMLTDFPPPLQSGLAEGKLRGLASSGSSRSAAFPDIPTVAEAGIADYEVTAWNALYAPAGTPQGVIAVLSRALQEVLTEPDVRRRMLELGIAADPTTPAKTEARMHADVAKWGEVIERAGIPKL